MSCTPAPACKVMLSEATRLFPNRLKASDGICASPTHTSQNPTSDHETGDAVDLTHDPANGCDVEALFAYVVRRRDRRVKYLIFNRRILRSYAKPGIPAWTWSAYTGSNPHVKHGHCSINAGTRGDITPWFTGAPTTTPPEDDMTPAQAQQLDDNHNRLANLEKATQDIQKTLAEIVSRLDTGGSNTGNATVAGKYTIDIQNA